MSKEFTANDVKEAGSVDKGLHIIIDNNVYKMDGFVEEHPGGAKILKRVGGKDASKQVWKVSGYPYVVTTWRCATHVGPTYSVYGILDGQTWVLVSMNGLRYEILKAQTTVLIRRTTANTPSQYHNESVLKKYQERLKVGTLKESAKL